MSLIIRIILSTATLGTCLAMLYWTILGIGIHQPVLVGVGVLLTIGFGVFVYRDAKFWIGKLRGK